MQKISIGAFAKQMNVSVRTLQYYDQINLLKPSGYSDSGRRYYTAKESVLLMQIKSLKQIGLSLEEIQKQLMNGKNLEEIKKLLHRQKISLRHQIDDLNNAYTALHNMEEKIHEASDLNYEEYMSILSKMMMNPSGYWIYQNMDDTLNEHIQNRFVNNSQGGMDIFNEWNELSEAVVTMMKHDVLFDSEEAQQVAATWWDMIVRFTGGDMELITHLATFNKTKPQWESDVANRQAQIDEYIDSALALYLQQNLGIDIIKKENEDGNSNTSH